MEKLLKLYETVLHVHKQLDSLIKNMLFKQVREIEKCKTTTGSQSQAIALVIKRFDEDDYDQIAYSDSINLRFQFYYKLIFKFLKLYLQEHYSLYPSNNQQLLSYCKQKNILNRQETAELTSLTLSLRRLSRTDQYGSYPFNKNIIKFSSFFSIILARTNPTPITAQNGQCIDKSPSIAYTK